MEKFSHPTAQPEPPAQPWRPSSAGDIERNRQLERLTYRFGEHYRIGIEGGRFIADRPGRCMVEATAAELEAVLEADLPEWREERQTQHPERF